MKNVELTVEGTMLTIKVDQATPPQFAKATGGRRRFRAEYHH
jgi:hypothetical protein